MTDKSRLLPIFPLNIVLLPFEVISIRIFEDRYKKMLHDSLDNDSEIGIVLIKSGNEVGGPVEIYEFGTLAKIKSSEKADTGDYYLILEGLAKFSINETVTTTPYMIADIEIISEKNTLHSNELEKAKMSFQSYINYLLNIQGEWKKHPIVPEDPIKLSYLIPQLLNLELFEKQHFLEINSSKERIENSLSYLNTEIVDLSKKLNTKMTMQYGRN